MKKFLLRFFGIVMSIIMTTLSFIIVVVGVVFTGPSQQAKIIATNTFTETSALKFVPELFLSAEEVESILKGDEDKIDKYIEIVAEQQEVVEIVIPTEISDEMKEQVNEDGVIITKVAGDTFMGVMAIIPDPSRIGLAVAPEFSSDANGIMVKTIASYSSVMMAFNGGEFADDNGMGAGGMPMGIVIKDGQIISNTPASQNTFIGFDYNNKLIVANITAQEAINQGARIGVTFGPVLISNGEIRPLGSSGFNPRTAIGQRQDGTVLILVVDGRQPHSLGATYQDLANVMLEFGAVTAGNLDGGTSSNLFYRDQRLNIMASALGERRIPTVFTVSELAN